MGPRSGTRNANPARHAAAGVSHLGFLVSCYHEVQDLPKFLEVAVRVNVLVVQRHHFWENFYEVIYMYPSLHYSLHQ